MPCLLREDFRLHLLHVKFAIQLLSSVAIFALMGCGLSPSQRTTDPALLEGTGEWKAGDGLPGTYEIWSPEKEPEAVWILVHGFSGAADDLERLARAAVDWGDRAYALNLRGMGPDVSGEERGDVESPREWPTDLKEFAELVSAENPQKPLYLAGESLGVSIILASLAVPNGWVTPVEGVVLLSPVVEFGLEATWMQRAMGEIFLTLTPHRRIDLAQLGEEQGAAELPPMTPIKEEQEKLEQAPHQLDDVTLRFLASSIDLINQTETHASALAGTPRFVAYGGKDAFIPAKRVAEFVDQLEELDGSTEVIFYPEGHHLLLKDHTAADLLEQVEVWRSVVDQNAE